MNAEQFFGTLGTIDDKYIMETVTYRRKGQTVWMRWGTMAACFCLVIAATVWGLHTNASNNNRALLEVDTLPPEGLSLTIVDAATDDAEFHLINESQYQVEYGQANRVERYDGSAWVEVTTKSVGIFPATTVTVQPETEMYGMIGLVADRIILKPGTYRYLLVVTVWDPDNGAYPVVLKAEFEIK